MDYSYKIGHTYIDKGGTSNPEDQFLRWINIDGSGMRNADGIRALNYVDKKSDFLPAYMILVSHDIKRIGNPWEDIVDFNTSLIKYWGDAKFHPKLGYQSFRGNKRLLQIWHAILDGNKKLIPPILHFSKPRKGVVKFNGVCSLTNLETTWFEQKGNPVKNYRCELTILDIEEVEISWLHYRARCEDLSKLNDSAPKTWKDYILGRTRKLDIWSKSILSKENQLPPEKSKESGILLQLNQLQPTQFEAVVVELFKNLPHVSHKIVRTRPTADGGFDFFGQFTIPYPIKYEIDFLGEAKKFAKNNAVQPKHVSRLVARLNRGQFGIFVTTSYYTKQTQKEVLEDGYPVKLFSGIDLVNIVHELRLVDNGKIKKEWLESVFQKMKISK
ncbi:restriction endonuclease [Pseudotenacibaculum haliotis]|uniref:Restriction endonuclease n=1 Tax=Pseudotenacibaculum haliotis TaxID=1862138 RepID=A0ABW5LVA2_9FLAO